MSFVSYGRMRFIEELKRNSKQILTDGLVHQTKSIIVRIIVTNITEVLTSLHDALDNIDLSYPKTIFFADPCISSGHVYHEHH